MVETKSPQHAYNFWTKHRIGRTTATQSFKPIFAVLPASTEASAPSSAGVAESATRSPGITTQLTRPYLKGMEDNSVFIDVTDIKDPEPAQEAFHAFNKDADGTEQSYLGRLTIVRKYLNRSFIETMWAPGSIGRQTILEKGITLEDGTFIKGFNSLPADAHIVHLKLERLSFMPHSLLKKDLETRLSAYGQVLDLGLSLSGRCYTGRAYATLNLTPLNVEAEPYAPLQHIVTWIEESGNEHDVFLQWDNMPDFCRNCQASDHCRADCPKRGDFEMLQL
jgi:hypothetical protein